MISKFETNFFPLDGLGFFFFSFLEWVSFVVLMITTLIRSHFFVFHSFSIALGDKNIMVPFVRERFAYLLLWDFME